VRAKSKLRQMIYWAAIGIGAMTLAAGILAAVRGGGIEPLLITAVFALGVWLVGRAARDVLGRDR
jgi:type IV secretory pathway TrbD component